VAGGLALGRPPAVATGRLEGNSDISNSGDAFGASLLEDQESTLLEYLKKH
jgi:hypothetical protein